MLWSTEERMKVFEPIKHGVVWACKGDFEPFLWTDSYIVVKVKGVLLGTAKVEIASEISFYWEIIYCKEFFMQPAHLLQVQHISSKFTRLSAIFPWSMEQFDNLSGGICINAWLVPNQILGHFCEVFLWWEIMLSVIQSTSFFSGRSSPASGLGSRQCCRKTWGAWSVGPGPRSTMRRRGDQYFILTGGSNKGFFAISKLNIEARLLRTEISLSRRSFLFSLTY